MTDTTDTEAVAAPGTENGEPQLTGPYNRSIGHGWRWISHAWELFTPAWGQWIVAVLVFWVILAGVQLIPMIGSLASSLLAPILSAGIFFMAHQARQSGRVDFADLFVGFRHRTGPLLGLGALNVGVTLAILIVVMVPLFASMDFQAMQEMDPNDEAAVEQMFTSLGSTALIWGLVLLALLIPWFAALWFAVPLIFFGGYGIPAALKNSLMGCVLNILPLLLYSIIILVLMLVATIPLLLGWLVLMPVLMIATYVMFRDIFSNG